MFWELQEANAANVEPFKRDYADTTKRLTEVIRDYGLGLNVMAAHRAGPDGLAFPCAEKYRTAAEK
jgi:hypothetical protein